MEKYKDIIVTLFTYEGCLTGRKIKDARDAIISDAFDVWDEDRIRRCFNFGNGTRKDWKRFITDNKQKVFPTKTFFEIVDSLPNAQNYYNYLHDILHY